ncbi:MAG: hypothetical protein IPJ84_14915 [Bdellovibrionales bacterium]|nr:hypothetical protein [Bdellovibrionales bacterium]
MSGSRVQIVFDVAAGGDPFALNFKVENRPIAARWLVALKESLRLNAERGENFSACRFFAFRDDSTAQAIRDRLYGSIKVINDWTPGRIPVQEGERLTQERLNFLHFEFEQMIGSLENRNPYFLEAPPAVQNAIYELNRVIHEIEMLKYASPRVSVEFPNCPRFPMEEADFNEFSFRRDFGDLVLLYCQLGKQVMDAWVESDTFVSKENIRPLHHYSSMFELYLRPGLSEEQQAERYRLMRPWLIEKGYDPDDPKLALGWIVLARWDQTGASGQMTQQEIVAALARRKHIAAICIEN